jgi:hypothetical protein
MTDVGRMSVAERVGKVLADRSAAVILWPSAIAASLRRSLDRPTIMRHAVSELLPGSASPALLHHIHDSTTTQGRARFHDPSRRGKMRHWGQESRGWGAGAWILDARIR